MRLKHERVVDLYRHEPTAMNYKNLNYEIETRLSSAWHPSDEATMNYKNLNYEIETDAPHWGSASRPLLSCL